MTENEMTKMLLDFGLKYIIAHLSAMAVIIFYLMRLSFKIGQWKQKNHDDHINNHDHIEKAHLRIDNVNLEFKVLSKCINKLSSLISELNGTCKERGKKC